MDVKDPDLMSWLLEESGKSENPADDLQWLLGDSQLIVVAGRSVNHLSLR